MASPPAASAAWPVEAPWHKPEAAVAGAAEVAASRLGGEPIAARPAVAASRVQAEGPQEPQGGHGQRAELPGELPAWVLGAFEEPQRYLCTRQAGEPGAEAARAERLAGAQRLVAQKSSVGMAAGTTSCIHRALFSQTPLAAEGSTVWAVRGLGMAPMLSAACIPA